MENLKLTSHFKIDHSEVLKELKFLTCNPFTNLIYVINHSNHIFCLDIYQNKISNCHTLKDELFNKNANIVSMEFILTNSSLLIGFNNGLFLEYFIETKNVISQQILRNNIDAFSLSPDQELIVIFSNQEMLSLFDSRLQEITEEQNVHEAYSQTIEMVNIGWGSNLTQFQGLKSKQAVKVFSEPDQPAANWDDHKVHIVWKGDSLFFAVSAIHKIKKCRIISIWNNKGVICYVNEQVNGLEDQLSWRPEGNLIAASQRSSNQHLIIFFEKNGLRHGNFSLPSCFSFLIYNIKWSLDSKVLLIHGIDVSKNQEHLYLYTTRNYHYYLKQTFCFKLDENINTLFWDTNVPLRLHLFLTNGKYLQFEWIWTFCSSNGVVAVIDGNYVQITPFHLVTIPPPLCGFSLIGEHFINEVFVYKSNYLLIASNKIILTGLNVDLDSSKANNQLISIKNDVRSILSEKLTSNSFQTFAIDTTIKHLRHTVLLDNYKALGIVFVEPYYDQLLCIDFSIYKMQPLCTLPNQVKALDCDFHNKLVALELNDKRLFKFDLKSNNLSPWTCNTTNYLSLPKLCNQIKICYIQSKPYIFGLSPDFKLFLNNRVFSTKCTSFFLTSNFLIITTTENNLQIWQVDEGLLNDSSNMIENEKRKLERGAKIVTCVEDDGQMILQVPRGNLEIIRPRILLLHQLKRLLDSGNYVKAFGIMQKYRINLNLLVDHNPASFFHNASAIIDSIASKNVQDICSFLSDLEEKNVCQSLYSFAYQNETNQTIFKYETTKQDSVCHAFRLLMMEKDESKYLIPILVTYVKQTNSSIDLVLKKIKSLESKSQQDAALKYLSYFIDEDRLYNEALGTYDFDIVLMVAERSQKDPKEYQAFLDSLKSIEFPEYRKYKIDLYLKRYLKALKHLKNCNDNQYLDECLQIVMTHDIYLEAIKIFEGHFNWSQEIWTKYGNYLMVKKYFFEAGFAFKQGNDLKNAIKAFQICEKWNLVLEIAFEMDDEYFQNTCSNLVLNLETNGKVQEAAYICEVYLNNLSKAIMILIKGHVWDVAQRLIKKSKNFELLTDLKQELLKHYENLIDLFDECKSKLNEHVKRLEVVKNEMRLKSLNQTSFENETNDFASDASSTSSFQKSKHSGSLTTCQSKSKKKQNLKKYVLKKGGAFEDLALIFAIKETIELVKKAQTEVALIIPSLYTHGHIKEASCVQVSFSQLIELVQEKIKIVWPINETTEISSAQFCLNDLLAQNKSLENRYLKDPLVAFPPQFTLTEWKFRLVNYV